MSCGFLYTVIYRTREICIIRREEKRIEIKSVPPTANDGFGLGSGTVQFLAAVQLLLHGQRVGSFRDPLSPGASTVDEEAEKAGNHSLLYESSPRWLPFPGMLILFTG